MRRAGTTMALVFLSCAACASPAAPPASRTSFADGLIARSGAAAEPPIGAQAPMPRVIVPLALTDPLHGLVTLDASRRASLDAAPLDAVLAAGVTPDALAYLAATRSPTVAAARARRAAARTRIAQSRDLAELVGAVAVIAGKAARHRGHDGTAPRADDRSPGVDALSAELAHRGVAIAHEGLRASVRDAVASALRLHADARYVLDLRAILTGELDVFDALLDVMRARQESGLVGEAAVAGVSSRRARVAADLAALTDRGLAVAAGWDALLARHATSPVPVVPRAAAAPLAVDVVDMEQRARRTDPGVRAAGLRVERADLALRLAETMTTGPADARPADVRSPPLSFGVRAAQVAELRALAASAREALAAAEDTFSARVRAASAAVDEAARMRRLHATETVPLAERARDAVRASFEAGRATSADLLFALDDVLTAERASVAAERDVSYAAAALIRAAGHSPHTRPVHEDGGNR